MGWHILVQCTYYGNRRLICQQLDSTCLLVLSQAAPLPETLQPQWWQPRWGEGTLTLTKSLASRQGSCRGHVDACLQCVRVFPLEFPRGLRSPSICLPLCGRGLPSDLSVLASSQALHLMRGKLVIYIKVDLKFNHCTNLCKLHILYEPL